MLDRCNYQYQWKISITWMRSGLLAWLAIGFTLPALVQKLRTLGVRSLVFDPCGNTPEQGDFLSVMQQNAARLEQALP